MTLEEIKNTKKYQEATILFLQKNNQFKNEFINLAPQIRAEIESSFDNPSCSCKQKIVEFIDENTDLYLNFLYNYLVENNLIFNFNQKILEVHDYVLLSGKVLKTSISDWEKFSIEIEKQNGQFNSFSVIKDGDDIIVFFL
jgi:hypothetical protein